MSHIKLRTICVVISILILSSCTVSHEYNIDPAFSDYLQRFENEGGARGHTFNPTRNGLIIEFGNLTDSAAGLTHYETPIRIQIDRTYWDAISKTAGADMMKEDLLFHELGHGLLGRKHLNSTLTNDDWKSIMCGGTKVNNRAWNINYRGERRKYYLDELFDENTPEPNFASMKLSVDTAGFTSVIQRNFNTVDQAIWTIGDYTNYAISLNNGGLSFQSKINNMYFVFAKLLTSLNIQSDFSYEMSVQYQVGSASNQYGLIFGPIPTGSNAINDSTEYFSINNNQKMYMGNRSWYSFYTELTESSVIPTGVNHLKVFKIGSMLYYFINNVYCYQTEIFANSNLNQFGFMVPPMGTVWIDNFKISQRGSSNIALKSKQSIQIVNGLQPVSVFNQNTTHNQ